MWHGAKKLSADDSRRQGEVKAASRLERNENGTLDDIVVRDVASFQLEQMSATCWWIGLTLTDGRRVRFDIWSKATVNARAEDE